jgi:hypothetical protein
MAISHSPENTAVHHGASTANKRHTREETKEYLTEYRKKRKAPAVINVVKKTEDDVSAASNSPLVSGGY